LRDFFDLIEEFAQKNPGILIPNLTTRDALNILNNPEEDLPENIPSPIFSDENTKFQISELAELLSYAPSWYRGYIGNFYSLVVYSQKIQERGVDREIIDNRLNGIKQAMCNSPATKFEDIPEVQSFMVWGGNFVAASEIMALDAHGNLDTLANQDNLQYLTETNKEKEESWSKVKKFFRKFVANDSLLSSLMDSEEEDKDPFLPNAIANVKEAIGGIYERLSQGKDLSMGAQSFLDYQVCLLNSRGVTLGSVAGPIAYELVVPHDTWDKISGESEKGWFASISNDLFKIVTRTPWGSMGKVKAFREIAQMGMALRTTAGVIGLGMAAHTGWQIIKADVENDGKFGVITATIVIVLVATVVIARKAYLAKRGMPVGRTEAITPLTLEDGTIFNIEIPSIKSPGKFRQLTMRVFTTTGEGSSVTTGKSWKEVFFRMRTTIPKKDNPFECLRDIARYLEKQGVETSFSKLVKNPNPLTSSQISMYPFDYALVGEDIALFMSIEREEITISPLYLLEHSLNNERIWNVFDIEGRVFMQRLLDLGHH
jgi:hypothetical protein